ncbi:MAG TPA: hypothetical protein VET87_25670 [Rubrivivax sp.]|nr:hypothetical protein [Rubrivivax sp.]
MTLKTRDGSGLALWRGLRAAALAGVAVLLVACGGDSDCTSPPAFEGGPVGECIDDGGGSDTPVASNLTLVLSANSLPNNGTDTITATATATGRGGVTLAAIPVSFSVNNDALATVSGTSTDETGVVTAQIGIGADRANRPISVTATSGGLTRTETFQVVGATLSATPLPAVIAPGAAGKVDFRLVDVNSNPMSAQTIVVNGVNGVELSGSTDSNGSYSYAYTAPATGGSVDIRATAGGVSTTQTVLVQSGTGTIPCPPAGLCPGDDRAVQSGSLSASPSVVPVNTSTTSNRSELRALFVGAGNAPVQNVRVRFDLAGDANNIGGSLTSGTNVVYSDVNGVATTAYVPGSRFSPTDGLTVRACWSANDFAAGTCPNAATATLTVVSDALSVSIFTDALIEVAAQSYVKTYTVQVVDSSGSAKGGVEISKSVDILRYFKGEWGVSGDKWVKQQRASCDSEDLNRNGVRDVYSNGAVEDANSTGELEPRKADVAISFVGSSSTDSSGQVKLKITYGQNVASWLEFNILVAASGVAGTEGRTSYQSVLPVLADAVSDPDKEPAFRLGPYGTQASPVVPTTNPTGQTGLLCTNPN